MVQGALGRSAGESIMSNITVRPMTPEDWAVRMEELRRKELLSSSEVEELYGLNSGTLRNTISSQCTACSATCAENSGARFIKRNSSASPLCSDGV